MSIKFKEGAVCYAFGTQFYVGEYFHQLVSKSNHGADFKHILSAKYFQLNNIKQGDYISASELDTEQKYNDAVEVFELFGFLRGSPFALNYDCFMLHKNEDVLVCSENLLMGASQNHKQCKRELKYPQLMAIGELKRMMNERDNAALNSSEETELKSRAMASDLNSEVNDEWPKVGDYATIRRGHILVDILAIDRNTAWVRYKDKPHIYNSIFISNLSKPKSKEDLLIEELQAKLVDNNAVDNWMLAANIINGDIDGLTYKGDSDD